MSELVRLFISSSSRGLKSFRMATTAHLKSRGFEPIVQEEFECTFQEVRHLIRDQLAPCDAVVLLLGPAYGFEPIQWPQEIPRRSYTQLEYDLAIELRKPVYRFLAAPNCPLDPFDAEPLEYHQRQHDHLAQMKHSDFLWYEFDSLPNLMDLLTHTRFHRRVPPNLPYASIGSLF